MKTHSKLLTTGLIVATAVFIALPALASAASYAYVDNIGDVKTVTANDWQTAIAIAPNIYIHSGVLLLDSAADYEVVGDDVSGF